MVALIALIVVVVALLLAAWGLRRRSADEVHSIDGYRHALHTLEDMRRGASPSVRVLSETSPEEGAPDPEAADATVVPAVSDQSSRPSGDVPRIGLVRPIHEDLGSGAEEEGFGPSVAPEQEEQYISARHAASSGVADPPPGSALPSAGDAIGRLQANGHVEVEVRDVLAPGPPVGVPGGPESADLAAEGADGPHDRPLEDDGLGREGRRGNGATPGFGAGPVEGTPWWAESGGNGREGDRSTPAGAEGNGASNGHLPAGNGRLADEERAPALEEGQSEANGSAAPSFFDPLADEGEFLGLTGANGGGPHPAPAANGEAGTTILPTEGAVPPGGAQEEGDDNPNRLVFDDFRPEPSAAEPYDDEAPTPPRRDRAVARMNHRPRRFLVPATAIVVALVAVVAVIVYAVTSKPTASPSAASHATTTAHAATTAPHAATTAPPSGATRAGHGSHPRTPARSTTTTAPPALSPLPGTATAYQASYSVPSGAYNLTLSVPTGACWVEVTSSASGAVLFTGTLHAGQSQVVQASGAASMDVGAPHSLSASVNGSPVTLPTGFSTPFTINFQPTS